MSLTQAMQRWGTDGYDYCSKTVCGQSADAMVQYYCLHQKGASASSPATVPARQAAAAAPASAGTGQKSPVGIVTCIVAIGIVLLAVAGKRSK
jgi:hypothetical protein